MLQTDPAGNSPVCAKPGGAGGTPPIPLCPKPAQIQLPILSNAFPQQFQLLSVPTALADGRRIAAEFLICSKSQI